MLDERKTAILRAVVQEYIETAQPVGSGHVARAAGVRVSAATVRNEMAVLEQEGYLRQPHTSAGRVPTDKGYRFFVDHLAQPGRLDARRRSSRSATFFGASHGAIEQMLQDTSRLLAGLTDYAAVVIGPSPEAAHGALRPARRPVGPGRHGGGRAVQRRRREPPPRARRRRDRAAAARPRPPTWRCTTCRARRWAAAPAASRAATTRSTACAMAPSPRSQSAAPARRGRGVRRGRVPHGRRVRRRRGRAQGAAPPSSSSTSWSSCCATSSTAGCRWPSAPSTASSRSPSCSVVVAPYSVEGEPVGTIGVLGPTRMNYPQALAAVEVVSERLGERLTEG